MAAGDLAFAIGSGVIRRQREGDIVTDPARVGPEDASARQQIDVRVAEITGEFDEIGFAILKPQVDFTAGIKKQGTNADIAVRDRPLGEGVEATLQLLASVEDDIVVGLSDGTMSHSQRCYITLLNLAKRLWPGVAWQLEVFRRSYRPPGVAVPQSNEHSELLLLAENDLKARQS